MSNKTQLGQFFTINNPFLLQPFKDWFFSIPDWKNKKFIEPFAGSNNIVKMVSDLSPDQKLAWSCYDIDPPKSNSVPDLIVIKKDTISSFPAGFDIAITNPPYLAKNSATRRKLKFCGHPYEDLYQKSLEVMLQNVDYVAAIIPESFITSGLFQNRLDTVISLASKMFDDTDCPVCLALFSKTGRRTNDSKQAPNFKIYQNEKFVGEFDKMKKYLYQNVSTTKWRVNDKTGSVGCICIDDTKQPSIKFVLGSEIDPTEVIVSSRAKTRISGLDKSIDVADFVNECNKELKQYRLKTKDIFLTSFKGLRKDGKYRRRLDFKTMKQVMSVVETKMLNHN